MERNIIPQGVCSHYIIYYVNMSVLPETKTLISFRTSLVKYEKICNTCVSSRDHHGLYFACFLFVLTFVHFAVCTLHGSLKI